MNIPETKQHKTNNPNKKFVKDLIDISPKEISKWPKAHLLVIKKMNIKIMT